MEYSYVTRNLRRAITYSIIRKNSYLSNETLRKQAAQAASLQLSGNSLNNVFLNAIKKIIIKKKPAYTVNDPIAFMAMNLLNKNILKSYNIKQKNRNELVSIFISHIKESYPFNVHRFDIKSFYESVDRKLLIKRIRDDNILSPKSVRLLELFFHELDNKSIKGLPRGLAISATLSELCMKDFDSGIISDSGILYYARFVDDIINFANSTMSTNAMMNVLNKTKLPGNLEFHSKGDKKFHGNYPRAKSSFANEQKIVEFGYLGYKFTIKSVKDSNDAFYHFQYRVVDIDLSDDKIEKIKNRIIKSFCRFMSGQANENFDILLKRIKFLTGNYELEKIGYGKSVKSGIFYNYKFLNVDFGLKSLDSFYKHILFGNTRLSQRLKSKLSYRQRIQLSSHSFTTGFKEVKFHRFSYADFENIKKAWL
ncbi:antiviral reverse transcriptase Drt3a [Rheinheimera texasensis]|uniref:antiviral reverse transcriptase Drt3a n=1 Tax=Rheinheimera texasensis TaxID=306205 RepID=UPI0032B11E40